MNYEIIPEFILQVIEKSYYTLTVKELKKGFLNYVEYRNINGYLHNNNNAAIVYSDCNSKEYRDYKTDIIFKLLREINDDEIIKIIMDLWFFGEFYHLESIKINYNNGKIYGKSEFCPAVQIFYYKMSNNPILNRYTYVIDYSNYRTSYDIKIYYKNYVKKRLVKEVLEFDYESNNLIRYPDTEITTIDYDENKNKINKNIQKISSNNFIKDIIFYKIKDNIESLKNYFLKLIS